MRCLRSLQRQLVHFLICGAVLGLYTSLNQNYSPNTAGTALPGTTTEQSRRSRNEIVHDQASFLALMSSRAFHISSLCPARPAPPDHTRLQLLYSQDSSLLWCPVFKAASTSWMLHIITLSGNDKDRVRALKKKYPGQSNSVAKHLAPPPSSLQLASLNTGEGVVRMVILRHPFHRLVSAFRDKLERCHSVKRRTGTCNLEADLFYNKHGKNIVDQQRQDYLNKFGQESLSQRWEFVSWLLADTRQQQDWDNHWKPAAVQCSPCSINFNYVLHFEQLENEEKWLFGIIKGGDRLKPRKDNQLGKEGVSESALTTQYMALLSAQQVEALTKLYAEDMALGGYTWPEI